MKQKGTPFWIEHIAAIKREAISTSAYAKRHKIAVKSLYYWQRKLNAAASPQGGTSQPKAFVALRVSEPVVGQGPASCTLVLESGMRLEMSALPGPAWLAALVRATQGVR